jgi:DNA polymerase alpha subunit B
MFNQAPDILITPSDLITFAKNIDGCICINPGPLVKAKTGGTYATITIDPLVLAKQMNEDDSSLLSNRAADRIRVDIFNI